MEYRDNVKLDQSRVRYGGGGGGGRKVALGGIGGIIVLALVVLLGGGNAGDILNAVVSGHEGTTSTTSQSPQPDCEEGGALRKDRNCRWVAYENALTAYWSSSFGNGFKPISGLHLFTGTISTACGTGSTEMGPFYCPGDTTIYVDDEFMGYLLETLGTSRSDAAELYIVGHEYGHHISHLTGTMAKARGYGDQTGPKSAQVRLELQADCYAGVFFANTVKDPDSPIAKVTQDDLKRIVDAARAVGDDHIQQQQGGRVVEESWTHGSSEMRQRWATVGFTTGDPNKCDTFATNNL